MFVKSLHQMNAPGVSAGAGKDTLVPTEWGLFHRVDVAIKQAHESSPAVKEVYDVAKAMGAMFGVGEGSVILRSAAQVIGEVAHVTPDQCGTRKIVAVVHTVSCLRENLCHLLPACTRASTRSKAPIPTAAKL